LDRSWCRERSIVDIEQCLGNPPLMPEHRVDDAALAAPTPVERYRQRFPTVMCAVDFLITSHQMLHLGQLSAWRRIKGLGSAM
ncbi:MAG: hypothetical protein AAFY46_05680, partial [Planctomycetota bacterium]